MVRCSRQERSGRGVRRQADSPLLAEACVRRAINRLGEPESRTDSSNPGKGQAVRIGDRSGPGRICDGNSGIAYSAHRHIYGNRAISA